MRSIDNFESDLCAWRITFDGWNCGGNKTIVVAADVSNAVVVLKNALDPKLTDGGTEVFVTKIVLLGRVAEPGVS